MNFIFHGEIINYEFTFTKKNSTVLFLHGWGGDKNSFQKTNNLLLSRFNVLSLTMPTTSETKIPWSLDNYVNLVKELLKLLNITKLSIICHSFGFRVVTILKEFVEIEKIVVTGGAGPKKINLYKRINSNNNQILLKKRKYQYLFEIIASLDYKNLSLTNKQTFKNILNFNTQNLLKFNCPMLLFWGKKDKETPLFIAKKIKRQNNSKLVVTNSDHFAYLKENALFNNEVLRFL